MYTDNYPLTVSAVRQLSIVTLAFYGFDIKCRSSKININVLIGIKCDNVDKVTHVFQSGVQAMLDAN